MARNKPKTDDVENEIEAYSESFRSALAAANAKVDTALDEWINCGEILENAEQSVPHGTWLQYRTTHFAERYNKKPTELQAYVAIYTAATGGLKKNAKPYLEEAKAWWLKNKNTPLLSGWSGHYEFIRAYLARDKTKREAKPRAKPVPRARHDKIVAALLGRERILARIVLEDRKALPADLPPMPADDDGGDEPPPPAAVAPGRPVAAEDADDGANCEPANNLPPMLRNDEPAPPAAMEPGSTESDPDFIEASTVDHAEVRRLVALINADDSSDAIEAHKLLRAMDQSPDDLCEAAGVVYPGDPLERALQKARTLCHAGNKDWVGEVFLIRLALHGANSKTTIESFITQHLPDLVETYKEQTAFLKTS